MHEPLRGRLPQGPRDMPWRPGGCTTECDELCFAERRPADIDMEPIDIRPGTNNPLFFPQPPRVVRRSAASFRRAGEGAKEPRCRRGGASGINPLFPPTSAGRKTIGGLVRRRGTRRREAQVEPRRLGGRYKWNRHAERGVGGKGKLNRRADPHGRRNKSLYREARLLSWRGAPAGPRGRARVGRFAAWVGAGEPRPNALHEEEEGARSLPGRRPSPRGLGPPPGLESPPRPAGVERGHTRKPFYSYAQPHACWRSVSRASSR